MTIEAIAHIKNFASHDAALQLKSIFFTVQTVRRVIYKK